MTESSESVRKDSSERVIRRGMQIHDWSNKRVILPRGTTLPSDPRPGEVFWKEAGGGDKLVIYSDTDNNWQTVWP